jgi:phosphoribosylglycinamide formyltransferase-1
MKKLIVLISNAGTGSNLQAIIDAIEAQKLQATILAVVSDAEDVIGLQKAKRYGIKTLVCPKKELLLHLLQKPDPDYIVLAGWKQIIADAVVEAFPNRILNLHPGIIPDSVDEAHANPDGTEALWNKGKFMDIAMINVLKSKATYAGSSVHFLTHEFDFGPVLGRTYEKVRPGDTIETLYTRLKKKENKLYVAVLQKLCNP